MVTALPKFRLSAYEFDILVNVLSHSKDGALPELKLKIFQTLKRLRKRRRAPFGMIIVLGWKREWDKKYSAMPDKSQNLFIHSTFDFAAASEERALEKLAELADFDGAILMNSRGQIIASGIYLESMAPKKVAEILNPQKTDDLSRAFGFSKKVHTRHMAAIAASWRLKNTTVFVVSEEDGSIRIFENGRIIFSTIREEIHRE